MEKSIQFEEINFNFESLLIKVAFFTHRKEYRIIYAEIIDFQDWVEQNMFLNMDNESMNHYTGEFEQSTHKIPMDELMTECSWGDYRNDLAQDFFNELLNCA